MTQNKETIENEDINNLMCYASKILIALSSTGIAVIAIYWLWFRKSTLNHFLEYYRNMISDVELSMVLKKGEGLNIM